MEVDHPHTVKKSFSRDCDNYFYYYGRPGHGSVRSTTFPRELVVGESSVMLYVFNFLERKNIKIFVYVL